ncbi:MAG: hypothetical protein ACE5K9_04860 [Candidatus Methylomirabilales bacterium]
MRKSISVIAAIALLSACANRPLTSQEQGALTGAALGAAAGSLIAAGTGGNSAAAAAAGMGLGALTGAMVGGAIENERAEADNTTASPGPTATTPPEPTAAAQAAQPTTGTFNPNTATIDPTVGKFVNGTRWRVEIFVDTDPQDLESVTAILLNPQESHPQNLDLGPHRITARAYVDTQFGTRTVGRYDRTVQVDPRGSGWTLLFTEGDFR